MMIVVGDTHTVCPRLLSEFNPWLQELSSVTKKH